MQTRKRQASWIRIMAVLALAVTILFILLHTFSDIPSASSHSDNQHHFTSTRMTTTRKKTPETIEEKLQQIIEEPLDQKLERIKTDHDEVIVTTATAPFKQFLYNWLCSVKKLGMLQNVLVYTVDRSIAVDLVNDFNFTNIHLEQRQWKKQNDSLDYGSLEYRMLMVYRTEFIRDVLLGLNYRVLVADNDAVWLHANPLRFIRKNYANKDLVGQNDNKNQVSGENIVLCGGFLYLNNTEEMKDTWNDVTNKHTAIAPSESNKLQTEQFILNEKKIFINYAVLPWMYFPNGYSYFQPQEVTGIDPETFGQVIVVHNNWIIGKQAKLERFMSKPGSLWLLNNKGQCIH